MRAGATRQPALRTSPGSSADPGMLEAQRGKLALSGFCVGVGVAAFVDETVFHQLLHWHHFYDKASADVGLVSDGLFHAFGWVAIVAGLVLYADLRRRGAFQAARWWGFLLLGLGGFQLYDGVIQHKLLGLHQIRYHVNLLPYDTVWIATAVLALAVGSLLVLRTAHHRAAAR